MKITISNVPLAVNDVYTLLLPFDEGFDKIAMGTLLSSFNISGVEDIVDDVKGKPGEFHTIYANHNNIKRVFLIGMGTNDFIAKAKSIFITAVSKNSKFLVENLAFDISLLKIDSDAIDLLIEQSICGMKIGLSGIPLYKTSNGDPKEIKKIHIFSEDERMKDAALKGISKGETIAEIIDLVNAPSNYKTVNHLTSWLQKSSKKHDYNLQVLDKDDLEKQGFHALLAVNRGSEIPAKCLIARYKPVTGDNLIKVTIVGKGVTFDTGGLSIKGRNNMHYMKSDMGGAAAAMGAIELAAKLNIAVDLTAIIPTTDNSVDALSIKPGDVISSYSGKSIEVIDTDAEGRLILADALSYAVKNISPDYLVDLATLTGSVVSALGPEAAGIMSHNDDLVAALIHAGEVTGEKLWRLPLWKEYAAYMESDIADVRNLGTKPYAGAITAGKFLENFVEDHQAWAHIDIAGTAFGNFPTTKSYSATGFGIDLIVNWLVSLTNK